FERDDRVAEQIVPLAIAAVVIARRAAESRVYDAASFVHSEPETPVVHALASFSRALRPGVAACRARTCGRNELPSFRSGLGAKASRVSSGTFGRLLPAGRSYNERVLVDGGRRSVRYTRIHNTFLSEAGIDFAGAGDQGHHLRTLGIDDPCRIRG